ncbi:MAG: glutamate-5-semialdehyde dehydrogenase [Gemmataceae bacterium]|nr:glutamate-5-semialdehyde dehydrogenase [Gemmataceae bacterium]
MEALSDVAQYCSQLTREARAAARRLASMPGSVKDSWLLRCADHLEAEADAILAANEHDLRSAADHGLTAAQIDRLTLTRPRIAAMAAGLRQVAALRDPVGEIVEGGVRPNGLEIRKVRVPIGVILFLYESRPNVTVDAAGLAVKSGNAIILRGGKEALNTNRALHYVLQEALQECHLPPHSVQLVAHTDRAIVGELLQRGEEIDLCIPRGGESLIRRVVAEARMPVLKHYRGNCHVYVDRAADVEMAERIVLNAKCQRPGVCNAAESLLVHQSLASSFLPRIVNQLQAHGVEVRGCPETMRAGPHVRPATDEDYAAEFLDLIISVRVVPDLEAALDHIARFGSRHTEAIVTQDLEAARRFVQEVDAAAVMVNASTRFHDGYEFGLGAEIGISTDKFHARGPCGLRELTTTKYIVMGTGQVRG